METLSVVGKNQTKPLIGIDFVVEIEYFDSKEPIFICTLCDKRCDPRNIIPQLVSHRHRINYLELLFPSLMKILTKYENFNINMTFREDILTLISEKIQARFGVDYQKVKIFNGFLFENNKEKIVKDVREQNRCGETSWPGFIEEFTEFLKTFVLNRKNEDLNEPHASRFFDNSTNQQEDKISLQKIDTAEKFRFEVILARNSFEAKFKKFQKRPESHPKYSEEWINFWHRKRTELQLQGTDVNVYDFKPEWIKFWFYRMKELNEIDFAKEKEKIRNKHGLFLKQVTENEMSSNSEQETESLRESKRQRNSMTTVKISNDSDMVRSSESRNKKHRMENSTRFGESSKQHQRPKSPEYTDEGSISLVSVCRLLTALEPELGLLASSVHELLSKAIALEKMKPHSSEKLLEDENNFNVLATVKEKLRGVLTANLIAPMKTSPIKRSIVNISTLLHFANEKKSMKTSIEKSLKDSSSVVDTIKLQISQAITDKLIKEGRTNISAEDLEALVESFFEVDDDENPREQQVVAEKTIQKDSTELSDSELQILLENFEDLMEDEQKNLITFLTKMEKENPERVTKLKKFVNL